LSEPAKTRAVIHDLGYKRYVGNRRAQSTRWRVISGNVLRSAWRGWWRLKIWMILVFVETVSFGAVLYVSQDKVFERIVGQAGQVLVADALLPYTYTAMFFPFLGFIVSISLAAGAIARDLDAGAFEFYFSRPVRPFDYLAGKLVGLVAILWLVVGAGPLLLSLLRLGLAENGAEAARAGVAVAKVAAIGGVAAFAFASIALGFSALSRNRKHTIAIWAGYYLIAGTVLALVASKIGVPTLAALDVKNAIGGMSMGFFDFGFQGRGPAPSLAGSMGGLGLLSAAALGLAYWRVALAEKAGLGGA